MSNQEILNNASREYIDLQEFIKEILNSCKKKFNEKNVFDSLDILIQILLLYLSVSNSNVSEIELSFIKLLTTEKDVLINYNKLANCNYKWKDLRSSCMNEYDFKELIKKTYVVFAHDIDGLIMILSGRDAVTKDDDLEVITNYIRNILVLFTDLDSNDNKDIDNVDYILENIFIKRYEELKAAFSAVNIKF